MRTKRIAAAFALLSSLSACGGAVESQGEAPAAPACGYEVALPDGGEEIRFASTSAWSFVLTGDPTTPDGYTLVLQGDAEALSIPEAEVVGACLRSLLNAGEPSGTTTL